MGKAKWVVLIGLVGVLSMLVSGINLVVAQESVDTWSNDEGATMSFKPSGVASDYFEGVLGEYVPEPNYNVNLPEVMPEPGNPLWEYSIAGAAQLVTTEGADFDQSNITKQAELLAAGEYKFPENNDFINYPLKNNIVLKTENEPWYSLIGVTATGTPDTGLDSFNTRIIDLNRPGAAIDLQLMVEKKF